MSKTSSDVARYNLDKDFQWYVEETEEIPRVFQPIQLSFV